jgi:hypothetical protein
MNSTWYKWFGGEAELHRPMEQHLIDYRRSIFNHASGDSFERCVLDAQNGVTIHRSYNAQNSENYNRWTQAEYAAFVGHLTANWESGQAHIRMCIARDPDIDYSSLLEPLNLPRPIYWHQEHARYETEEWFERSGLIAA